MKHILLVFSRHVASRAAALQCMQRIAVSKQYNSPYAKDSTFVKTVTTGPEVEELLYRSRSTNNWLSVEETISVLTRIKKQENAEECCAGSVASDMETLARGLHDAADSLPYLGSCTDIILCMGYPEAVATDIDSVLPVAGALRRLFDWHNGCALVVKLGRELSCLEHHLTELAHCQVIKGADELHLNWPGWRGKVAVVDHIENKGHMFPTCRLESPDWGSLVQQKVMCVEQDSTDSQPEEDVSPQQAVCGRTAEVLQEVDLRTFPLCLLDSWSLHLHAEQQSTVLVDYIQDLQQTGLLARVRVYPDISQIPCCASMNLSTAAWKDRVVSEVENMPEPAEEQVTDDWVYLYFLLLPNTSASKSSSVVAQVLLSPHEINSSILPFVEECILGQKLVTKHNRSRYRNETAACGELVLNQRDKFVTMLNLLKNNLQNMHSKCQDGLSKRGNAKEKTLGVTADIQCQIISAAFHGCPSVHDLLQEEAGNKIRWFTELALDPSKIPEKLAMQATEATRKVLRSFPSMDSLTSSSPPSTAEVDNNKDSVDFDVCEYFNPDGSLKEMSTCPVRSAKLKGRGLCRVDSQCLDSLQWPESMLLKYHDIFYYNSEINWSLEKRYSKVRDRGYFPDTRSSFVSPVKKAQQTHSMLRRSASTQSSVDSRAERPARMSPRKASMADIFKPPPSHSCSPRKQSQGSQNSLTPELPLFDVSTSQGQLSSDSTNTHSTENPKRSRESFGRNRTRNLNSPSAMDISNQSHRQRTLTQSETANAVRSGQKLPMLTSHDVTDLLCPVRRSPRRSNRPPRVSSDSSVSVSVEKPDPGQAQDDDVRSATFEQQRLKEASLGSDASEQVSARMKRSERHKLKLQRIIDHVLREKGVHAKDRIYSACSRNLFNVSMVLLKTLTTSQNLTEEMKTVVYGQVTQIINLEKRRCGMAL